MNISITRVDVTFKLDMIRLKSANWTVSFFGRIDYFFFLCFVAFHLFSISWQVLRKKIKRHFTKKGKERNDLVRSILTCSFADSPTEPFTILEPQNPLDDEL